jgi:hypothetical protein
MTRVECDVPLEALPVCCVTWTLMLVWVWEVEPVAEPLPCVVFVVPAISGFLILSGLLMLDVPVPVLDVLLPAFVVGVVLVGGTILC